MIAPLALVIDVDPFLTLARGFDHRPIRVDHRLLEECVRLLTPYLKTRLVEPFPIDQAARDRWVALMDNALQQAAFPPQITSVLRTFFHDVATFLINCP